MGRKKKIIDDEISGSSSDDENENTPDKTIKKDNKKIDTIKIEEKEIKENKKDNKILYYFKELVPLIIVIIAVLFVKSYIMTPIQVNGNSMDTTLQNGDIMILNKISYKIHGIKRFDIVVIKTEDTLLIKRVIGLPNEKVKIENNKLYINGKEYAQDFLDEDTYTDDFEFTNLDNCYFVMGDNRGVSLDSRDLGCFDKSKIQGTTSLTIYPFNRLGKK